MNPLLSGVRTGRRLHARKSGRQHFSESHRQTGAVYKYKIQDRLQCRGGGGPLVAAGGQGVVHHLIHLEEEEEEEDEKGVEEEEEDEEEKESY